MPDLNLIKGIDYKIDSKEKRYSALDDIAKDWEAIGRALGLEEEYLQQSAESSIDAIITARYMIHYWIHSDKNATWTKLIAAMRDGGKLIAEATELETALFKKITQ